MGRAPPSGITWFGDEFHGSIVTFDEPRQSWRLERKISEHEYYNSPPPDGSRGLLSEARAVYFCSRLDADESMPHEAVIKIWMQIPSRGTVQRSFAERAKQARTAMEGMTRNEVRALQDLTKAGCSSTPTLFGWKEDKQNERLWVPGGFIAYILMEKLPGTPLLDIFKLDRKERDEIREGFRKAWIECKDCGIVNIDSTPRNLLWDRATKRCYIVDFELGAKATPKHTWHNVQYTFWGLAYKNGGDREDMSTWDLRFLYIVDFELGEKARAQLKWHDSEFMFWGLAEYGGEEADREDMSTWNL